MKKKTLLNAFVSALMALVLLLSCAGSALATAVVSSVSVSYGDDISAPITSVTAVGDRLYTFDDQGAITIRLPGERNATAFGSVSNTAYMEKSAIEQLESQGQPALETLFEYDGALYGACVLSGSWYRLTDEAGAFAPVKQDVALDLAPEGIEAGMYQLSGIFQQDGWLYVTGMDYNTRTSFSYRVSLETGERKTFATKNLYKLAPWKDGLIGCYIYDVAQLTTANGTINQTVQFGLFDPQSDAIQTTFDVELDSVLGGYAVSGLCGDGTTLFYLCGSRVYGLDMQTGAVRTSAYTGEGMFGSVNAGQTICAGGYYIATGDELSQYPLDTDAAKHGALRIFGEFGTEPHKGFVKDHPEIPVDVGGDYTADLDKLTQAMLTEDDPYDVLLLNLSVMPVERLIEKGYCLDLSQYTELTEPVGKMLPIFAEAGMKDGKLYGVPVNMTATSMSVNMEKWTELGLAEDELPKNYAEFLDFFANWTYDYAEDHPDLRLFSYGASRDLLFSLLINEYLYYPEAHGEKLRFDTPMFRDLMKALSAVDFKELNSGDDSMMYYNKNVLFNFVSVSELASTLESENPLPLALSPDVEPAIPATISVLMINPKTQRLDQALAYVSYYVDHLAPTSANITMYPDHNEPIESKQNMKHVAELKKQLAAKEEGLESASEENKASIRADIDTMKDSIAQIEKYLYTVPEERIVRYREKIQPLLYVAKQGTLLSGGTSAIQEINTQLLQYLNGAIDLDTLVTQLDSRLKLMEMEN